MFAPGLAADDHETRRARRRYQPATRWFSTSSNTVATSPSRAAPPAAPSVVDGAHDHLLPLIGIEQLIVDADREPLRSRRRRPSAGSTVAAATAVRRSSMPRPIAASDDRVEADPDRGLDAAADADLADAGNLRDLLREHRVRRLEHLRQRQRLRAQREDQDRRVARIDLAVVRPRRQVRRQIAAGGVDRGLDVARRALDVAVEPELDRDARRAERAHRGQLADAGDPADPALERHRDGGRHRVRARAGQRRVDVDRREVDFRQRADGQLRERGDARQEQRDREERRRDRPPDERRR